MQVLLTKKANTMKQYWPQLVKILCYAATCSQAAREDWQAGVDADGPQDFVDDPDHPHIVHPSFWDATRHLQYLQHANAVAGASARMEVNAAGKGPTALLPGTIPPSSGVSCLATKSCEQPSRYQTPIIIV